MSESPPMRGRRQGRSEVFRFTNAALFFAAFTYVMLTVRSSLMTEVDLLSGVRLLTTFVAAAIYLATLLTITRLDTSDRNRQLRILLYLTMAAAGALLVSRSAFDLATDGQLLTLRRELLLVVTWVGYFVAWIFGFLVSARGAGTWKSASASENSRRSDAEHQTGPALWADANGQKVKVPVSAIVWIEAEGNYVRLHHEQGSGLLRAPLSRLEKALQSNGIVRIHRSALCQRRHITAYSRKPGGALRLTLSDGTEVPVGRTYAATVTAIIEEAP